MVEDEDEDEIFYSRDRRNVEDLRALVEREIPQGNNFKYR